MNRCHYCGKNLTEIPYECHRCGNLYCSDHRLPENHNCSYKFPNFFTPLQKNPINSNKECYQCGVKTLKLFHCPICGFEFCSLHINHQDQYNNSVDQFLPLFTNAKNKAKKPKIQFPEKIKIKKTLKNVAISIGAILLLLYGCLMLFLVIQRGISPTYSTQSTYEIVQSAIPVQKVQPIINQSALELDIHKLINQQRASHGLSTLRFDQALSAIARKHSLDMAQNGYFEHVNLQGLDPSKRASQSGYSCYKNYGSYYTTGIAENIMQNNLYDSVTYYNGIPRYAWNSQEELAQSTVTGWMNSPGHRQNILTLTYDREGIGIAIASDDKVYITEDFC